MRVINSHKRIINQPKENVSELFKTLAKIEDKIWPYNNWPAMRFKEGLKLGSRGGHGLVRYTIIAFEAGSHIKFEFTKPEGFYGTHELNINAISENTSEINHIIKMKTTFKASFLWVFIIRWLHDALIEEAFDNVQNYFSEVKKETKYNLWVTLLRDYYKRKAFQTKQVLLKKVNKIDIELVIAFQAGDQKAIAELVKRWHLTFCKKAFWMVKDAHLSKDIVQESWQTIMNKLHTLDKPSSFKSWALRIVFSKSIDVLRQQSKKQLRETNFNLSQVVGDNDYKEENTELKEALLNAIKLLPEQQQGVIRLFYTEDYSLKEISKLLNVSIGTTKSRLFHAREKLKLILKNNNYEK